MAQIPTAGMMFGKWELLKKTYEANQEISFWINSNCYSYYRL
jgi:hypothetical protein